MTVWDYLDKHEIIGTFTVLVALLLVCSVAETFITSVTRAWAARATAALAPLLAAREPVEEEEDEPPNESEEQKR